eukprot:2310293-Rhodomonas_salina.1
MLSTSPASFGTDVPTFGTEPAAFGTEPAAFGTEVGCGGSRGWGLEAMAAEVAAAAGLNPPQLEPLFAVSLPPLMVVPHPFMGAPHPFMAALHPFMKRP